MQDRYIPKFISEVEYQNNLILLLKGRVLYEFILHFYYAAEYNIDSTYFELFAMDPNSKLEFRAQLDIQEFSDMEFFDPAQHNRSYLVVNYHRGHEEWASWSNVLTLSYQPIVWIPNSFTPNGDGLNDVYKPSFHGIDPNTYSIHIYDRWGGLVFSSHDLSVCWDGFLGDKLLPSGVYFYRIHCLSDAASQNQLIINRSGQIHLIR